MQPRIFGRLSAQIDTLALWPSDQRHWEPADAPRRRAPLFWAASGRGDAGALLYRPRRAIGGMA